MLEIYILISVLVQNNFKHKDNIIFAEEIKRSATIVSVALRKLVTSTN